MRYEFARVTVLRHAFAVPMCIYIRMFNILLAIVGLCIFAALQLTEAAYVDYQFCMFSIKRCGNFCEFSSKNRAECETVTNIVFNALKCI